MEQPSTLAQATAKALYEAYNSRQPRDAAALYALDGCHEEVAEGRVREGRKAISEGLENFFGAFPDIRWEKREVIAEENTAAVAYTLTGTLRSDLGPIPARGQRLELRGVHVLRMAPNGLIQRTEDYWDMATFKRQMSADPGSSNSSHE